MGPKSPVQQLQFEETGTSPQRTAVEDIEQSSAGAFAITDYSKGRRGRKEVTFVVAGLKGEVLAHRLPGAPV